MNQVSCRRARFAVAILLMAAGCDHQNAAQPDPATASSSSNLVRVTAAPPERKTLELYTLQPGRIAAFEQAPLHPKVTGYVEEVLVDIGDPVEKGQTLVRISMPEMHDELKQKEALVAQAEAQVRQAEAAVTAAKAAVETARSFTRQAQAGVTRSEAEFERAQAEHVRFRALAASGSVTEKLVEEALNQLGAAEATREESAAEVDTAAAGLRQAEANVLKAEADLAAAEARLDVSLADKELAETLLRYSEIRAPFNGTVTQRHVDTGHYVYAAGSSTTQPLLVVARTDRVRIFVAIPETEAALVDSGENGDPATILVQALAGKAYDAQITRTSWALDPLNNSLTAEIDIDNPDQELRPGMYATVRIRLAQQKNSLVLPITALVQQEMGTFCCVVESGKIERRRIELAMRSGNEVAVASGLTPKETVVLHGAELLQHGQAVEVLARDDVSAK